jgi:hypothetical protein
MDSMRREGECGSGPITTGGGGTVACCWADCWSVVFAGDSHYWWLSVPPTLEERVLTQRVCLRRGLLDRSGSLYQPRLEGPSSTPQHCPGYCPGAARPWLLVNNSVAVDPRRLVVKKSYKETVPLFEPGHVTVRRYRDNIRAANASLNKITGANTTTNREVIKGLGLQQPSRWATWFFGQLQLVF